jgi:hypothetical protein
VKRLLVYCLGLAIISCSNREDVPNDIIPPDSMQNILKDIIMAEEYSSQYISRDTLRKDKIKANQELLEAVFKIHHTSKEEFRKSLNFYESRPDLNKKIFDSLTAYSNRHRGDLYAPKPQTKPVPIK